MRQGKSSESDENKYHQIMEYGRRHDSVEMFSIIYLVGLDEAYELVKNARGRNIIITTDSKNPMIQYPIYSKNLRSN